MKTTPLENKLNSIIEPALNGLGYDLVLLEFKSGILQILAENPKTGNLSLDDCTAINRVISPLLEVEDPIPGAYTLEISSPGIDRPLVKAADFDRYKGFEAKIELDDALPSGQKKMRGRIIGTDKEFVTLMVDNVEQRLELNNIKKARPVLTDELIKATMKQKANA